MDENEVDLFPNTINSYPWIGHIVQLITDNASAYKKAGKKLQQKYGTLLWSPCAAHCIDLML